MQKVTNILLGVLSFMALARLLSKEQFGVWGLFIVISSVVETTRFALVRNGYIVFKKTRDQASMPATEFAALTINIGFSLLLSIFFLFFGWLVEGFFNEAGQLSSVLNIYSIGLILLIVFSQCEIFFYSNTDFKSVFWMYFLRNGTFALVVAVLFCMGINPGIGFLAMIYCACIVPGCLVALFFLSKHRRPAYKWDKKIFFEYLSFGRYVLGTNMSSLVFVNADGFMTARSISAAAYTAYNIGGRITNFGDIPSQVFGDIMFPRAAEIVKTGSDNDVKKIYEKTVAATLCFLIPFVIVGILFADVAVLILGGEAYLGASDIVRVMLLYSLFLPFIKQFGNIMDVKGRPQVNFRTMFCFAFIGIGLTYVCINWLGAIGAAVGLLLTYMLLFAVTQVLLNRFLGISPVKVIRYVFELYPEFFRLFKGFFAKKMIK